MGKTKDSMTAELELRNYSESTKESYLKRARAFVQFHMRPAEQLGAEDVRSYLIHRKQTVHPSTLAVDVAALKFLYKDVLHRPDVVERVRRPKIPKHLPDILSGREVIQVLAAIDSLKHRTILTTGYGAGLRLAEACSLRVTDIDSKRMVIKVRHGKGGKDRYVMLSPNLLDGLRAYWKVTRPTGSWLFPGGKPGTHITTNAVGAVMRKAVKRLDLSKKVTPHVLRHSFATHLVETGVDIRTIQAILGHKSISSTQLYTRVSMARVAGTTSPLDLLGTKAGEVLG